MPKVRRNNRWEDKSVRIGFISSGTSGSEGPAVAYFYVDGKEWKKSLRPLRFTKSDRLSALKILRKLADLRAWHLPASSVHIHMDGTIETSDVQSMAADNEVATVSEADNDEPTVKYLYDLFYAFKEGKVLEGTTTEEAPRKFRDAFKCYFEGEQDFFLEDSIGIREHVMKKTTTLNLKDDTKCQYLNRLRGMFEYGVSLHLIPKNPLPQTRHIPLYAPGSAVKRKSPKRRAFSPEEYERFKQKAYAYNRALGLLVELYYYTGMRLSEATELRVADWWLGQGKTPEELNRLPHVIPDSSINICGKGVGGEARFRAFPLENPPDSDDSDIAEWQRNTFRIVKALVEEVAVSNNGRLCRWSSRMIQHHLLRVRRAAGIPDEVKLHSLRHTALTIMTHDLQLGKQFLDAAVGNSERIREKHYLAQANADQLRNMLRRSRETSKS